MCKETASRSQAHRLRFKTAALQSAVNDYERTHGTIRH